jgi:hypothetical protein
LFFWFKRKEIIFDCFTYSPLAYEYAKPDFAYKFFPEWFIKLPKKTKLLNPQNKSIDSLKSCLAFKKYYTSNTIIIPTPYHATINVNSIENPSYTWEIKFPEETAIEHEKEQFEGFLPSDYQHLKFSSPWKFKTNKLIQFMWADPVWNKNNFLDYSVLPGVVDYKYQFDTAINIVFRYKDKPHLIDFTLGEPLAILAPLSDCNIKIKHQLINKSEAYLLGFVSKYHGENKYKFTKKVIQAAEKRDAMTKCPFHLR